MPRASLSVGLLSTHTSGVQKKNLHTAIGRPSAFISPTKFRIKTSECTKIQQFFLLPTEPYFNGITNFISQGRIVGAVLSAGGTGPCYWNFATRELVLLSLGEYSYGFANAGLNSILVGQVQNLPCYWNSNVLTVLAHDGYTTGAAHALTATLIVGKVDSFPCYWTLSNNQLTILECLTYDGGIANDIDVTTAVGKVDGYPCYWDVANNLITVLNTVISGEAYSIDGNFIVGQLNEQPGYWELPSTTFTELPHEGYTSGFARAIDNDIIVGFVVSNVPVPCYWDSNRRLHLLPMTVNHVSFIIGGAFSIDQNVICGVVENGTSIRPCYWVI